MNSEQTGEARTVAVLASGGLDSAVLMASEAQRHDVQPIYVSCGLYWEPMERALLAQFLDRYHAPHALLPLVHLELPLDDLYPATHWAVRGTPPAAGTRDEAVYLVGRNIALLAKAGIYCTLAGIGSIAMGQLRGNPFPDATPEFFSAMSHSLSLGLAHRLEITSPFLSKTKADIIRLGASLQVPFELTLSCINPGGSGPCGACNKCRERRDAFAAGGVAEPDSR